MENKTYEPQIWKNIENANKNTKVEKLLPYIMTGAALLALGLTVYWAAGGH